MGCMRDEMHEVSKFVGHVFLLFKIKFLNSKIHSFCKKCIIKKHVSIIWVNLHQEG